MDSSRAFIFSSCVEVNEFLDQKKMGASSSRSRRGKKIVLFCCLNKIGKVYFDYLITRDR